MPVYVFGPFSLDSVERRLLRDGEPVALTGKAFEALEILAAAEGRLVAREALYARLWPDTVVEERTLTVHVSTLRRVLNTGDGTDCIETVPRAGYRLTVPVTVREAPDAASARVPAIRRRRLLPVLTAAAMLAVLAAAVLFYRDRPAAVASTPAPPAITLAVLPFSTFGIGEEGGYLGLGIADAVITQLSGLPRLGVRPTSAIGALAGTTDTAAAGRRLLVGNVLEGAIQRQGDRLRVTVRLVDTESGTVRWGDSFEQPEARAFELQDAIAHKVASALLPRLAAEEEAALQSYRPRSAEAYRLQLQARVNLARFEREPAFRAVEQFQGAITLDPDYALAHAGLASAYTQLTSTVVTRALTVEDGVRLARAAAERALAIDERTGEAHAVVGHLRFTYDWDWAGAERAFRRALELAPNSPDMLAAHGWFLAAVGRAEEGLAALARARQLDPLRRDTIEMLGFVQWMAGDAEQGLATLAEASDLDPAARRPYFRRMLILDALGRHDEAMAERARWLERFDEAAWAKEIVTAHRELGYRAALEPWLRMLDRLGQSYELGMQWMAVGERGKAIAALERCLEERCSSAPFMSRHPTFDALHGDPRFVALVARLRLPTSVPRS